MKDEVLSEDDLKILKEVAQDYVEEMHSRTSSSHDPFEMYAETLKSKFYANPANFTTRFIHGYQVLMQEIEKLSHASKQKR